MYIKSSISNLDYTLYLCVGTEYLQERSFKQCITDAILGGVTMIQIREKEKNTKDFLDIAIKTKEIADQFNIPIIINDRIDIALAVDASGVHLGQNDMPCKIARKILGNDKIIGISVTTLEEAIQAQLDGADYIGVGAMYKSITKKDAKVVSNDEFIKIQMNCSLPIVVIGGINEKTIPNFRDSRVDGYAMIRPILGQDNILNSSVKLKKLILCNRGIYES